MSDRRKTMTPLLLAPTFWVFALAAQAEVKLSAEQRESLGVKSTPVATAQVGATVSATAQVLDPGPLLTLMSDLSAAQAAAAGSASEYQRSQRLNAADANVSLKALEAARAQAAADGAKAQGLQAQLLVSWGRALVNLTPAARGELISALRTGHASLVRAESTASLPEDAQVHTASVQSLSGRESWKAQVLGPAAQLGSTGVGTAYILRVPVELQAGRVLTARLQDTHHPLSGLKVPASAIVRWRGSDWVYVEGEGGSFSRVLIRPQGWLDDGALIAPGEGEDQLKTGDKVATVGAAMLLAAENAPSEEEDKDKADEKSADTKDTRPAAAAQGKADRAAEK
jgi:hypothetical protein